MLADTLKAGLAAQAAKRVPEIVASLPEGGGAYFGLLAARASAEEAWDFELLAFEADAVQGVPRLQVKRSLDQQSAWKQLRKAAQTVFGKGGEVAEVTGLCLRIGDDHVLVCSTHDLAPAETRKLVTTEGRTVVRTALAGSKVVKWSALKTLTAGPDAAAAPDDGELLGAIPEDERASASAVLVELRGRLGKDSSTLDALAQALDAEASGASPVGRGRETMERLLALEALVGNASTDGELHPLRGLDGEILEPSGPLGRAVQGAYLDMCRAWDRTRLELEAFRAGLHDPPPEDDARHAVVSALAGHAAPWSVEVAYDRALAAVAEVVATVVEDETAGTVAAARVRDLALGLAEDPDAAPLAAFLSERGICPSLPTVESWFAPLRAELDRT